MASIILGENLAGKKGVRDALKDNYIPLVKRTRDDRRTYRETWLRYYRIWSATRDMEAYEGRLQSYFPIGRKAIEMWVKRLKRDLFPSDEWFSVRALREVFEQRAPGIKALLMHFYTKHAQVRRHATPWLRQLVTYGSSPLLAVWRLDEREETILRELFDDEGRLTGKWERVLETVTDFIGPTFQPIDLFSWYAWPVTCSDPRDCELVFQDVLVSRAKIKELSKTPLHSAAEELGMTYEPEGVRELFERSAQWGSVRDKYDAEVRRLQDKGFTHPLDGRVPDLLRPFDLCQGTWRARLDDDDGKERLYRVVLGNDDVPLLVQRAPWWDGQIPYLFGKFVEVQNELYGRGLPETYDKLQYFVNDIGNQAGDALVWSTNPIAVVDMFAVQDPDSIRMRPGAKWLAPPNAVEFTSPPQGVAQQGFNAMGQALSLIGDLSFPTPVAPQSGRTRGKTQQSTQGMQLMLAEAQIDVREVVELNEDLVFNPYLRKTHVLIQQCLDRDILLKITGDDGVSLVDKVMSVADVVGDYEMAWLGSVSTQNQQVRGMQMVNAAGIFAKFPPEAMAKAGYEFDWPYIAREIWGTGLGLPAKDRVVRQLQKHRVVDWRIENTLFRVGRGDEVKVNEGDPDDAHLAGHQHVLADPKVEDDVKRQMADHMRGHQAAKMAKQLMQFQQALAQGGGAGAGAGGGAGGPGSGAPMLPGPTGGGGIRMRPPAGPGRLRQTNDVGDLYRSMPRGVM